MILFIYGSDTYRSKQKLDFYRNGFLKKYGDMNVSIYDDGFDTAKIENDVMTLPFLSEKRLIVLKGIISTKSKDLHDNILEILKKKPDETVILFYEDDILDKRTLLFKKLSKEKLAEQFVPLEGSGITSWAKKEVEKRGGEADREALNVLAEYIGNDLWRLDKEISKLLNFDKKITKDNVLNLVEAKLNSNIFDLVDALVVRDMTKASGKMHELLDAGESEIYILTMIVRQIRMLILMKDLFDNGMGQDEITKTLKLHPYVVKKTVAKLNNFDISDLKKIYEDLVETDISIKRGIKEPKLALDLLVQKLCI